MILQPEDCQDLDFESTQRLIGHYVAIMCGVRLMSPDSLKKTYLPGIAATFDLHQKRNLFRLASNSKEVKLGLRGFTNFYRKHNPKSERVKVAFGMDLAVASKNIMRGQRYYDHGEKTVPRLKVRHARYYLVMCVGIMFLLRCSEHIKSRSDLVDPVKRSDFAFFDNNDRRIPYDQIGLIPASSVTITIKFTKTDRSGFGRRITHTRQRGHDEVCVVYLLEEWIKDTRDQYLAKDHMPLYHVPGFSDFVLSDLHQLMHDTVKSFGINDERIHATSHSLRYGGATMMAASGYPQYLIAIYGGWTPDSSSLKIYTRPSKKMSEMVSSFMVQSIKEQPSMSFLRDLLSI